MGRIVAIDYGRKRTGLAVTDPLQMIAGALDTVPTHTLMDFLKKYLPANGVETVVVGMPRQMDGTPSESYTYIRPFVTRLQKEFPDLRIEMFDERFTSKLAFQASEEEPAARGQRIGGPGERDDHPARVFGEPPLSPMSEDEKEAG